MGSGWALKLEKFQNAFCSGFRPRALGGHQSGLSASEEDRKQDMSLGWHVPCSCRESTSESWGLIGRKLIRQEKEEEEKLGSRAHFLGVRAQLKSHGWGMLCARELGGCHTGGATMRGELGRRAWDRARTPKAPPGCPQSAAIGSQTLVEIACLGVCLLKA